MSTEEKKQEEVVEKKKPNPVNVTQRQDDLEKQYLKDQEKMKALEAKIEELAKVKGSSTEKVIHDRKDNIPFGEEVRISDPGDYQDKPVIFSCYGQGWLTSSYRFKGMEIFAPRNVPMKFSYATSDRKMHGKEENIINISVYGTNSKAEIEWLRNHPLYGRYFFEDISQVSNIDPRRAVKLDNAIARARGLNRQALFAKAHSYGIPTSSHGTDELQMMVATRMIEEMFAEEEKIEQDRGQRIASRKLLSENK